MKVSFFSNNPRQKARQVLDQVLQNGVDELKIACAFCTAAGVRFLLPHVSRLQNSESFVVVAAAPPTNYAELAKLHRKIPQNLFVHWGSLAPVELGKVGAPLMHSKVFFARSGRNCWLWTGSHNLTGQATQGGNCEAAILLEGTIDELPFIDAREHLLACQAEATLYDPDTPPPERLEPVDILTIHAENDVANPDNFPWHVHLCLNAAEFDSILRAPGDVRLSLYNNGDLANGWQNATPITTLSGLLTGQNLTARNPNVRGIGTTAAWTAAAYGITEVNGLPRFGEAKPLDPAVTTQAVIFINDIVRTPEILLSSQPKIREERIPGETWFEPVDKDMLPFFRKKDRVDQGLQHVRVADRRLFISAVADELRAADRAPLAMHMSDDMQLELIPELPEQGRAPRHPFIMRARFRLPKTDE